MQNIIIEKPYRFVPPHRGTRWPAFIQRFNLYGKYLKHFEGVESYEVRGAHHLKKSLDAKHGVLLAPNHSRMSDPLVLGFLAKEVDCNLYSMASWHLFNQGWFKAWAIRVMGGFSIYREGVDRKSLATAVDAMVEADRPLVVFPEGSTTRTNDHLHALLDGVAFVARSAAKRRIKEERGKTVIHPIGIKYVFQGDIDATVRPVLHEIEQRLGWRTSEELRLLERVERMGEGLFCLEEIRYTGRAYSGDDMATRTSRLINCILQPLEKEWLKVESTGSILPRIKALRSRMLPDMIEGNLSSEERSRRWMQLEDIYVAQQISCYIPNYLRDFPSIDRLLETVERYEEDLKDKTTVHGALKVIIDVDEPIVVTDQRRPKGDEDPLMTQLRDRLQAKMTHLAKESKIYGSD